MVRYYQGGVRVGTGIVRYYQVACELDEIVRYYQVACELGRDRAILLGSVQVAVEMDYPDDGLPWIEIAEWMDRINYNYETDAIVKIKNEAKLLLHSSH